MHFSYMSDPKEIGEGGFGVVIKPALPNVNDRGAVRQISEKIFVSHWTVFFLQPFPLNEK